MYRILDSSRDTCLPCATWQEMIDLVRASENRVAHNANDTRTVLCLVRDAHGAVRPEAHSMERRDLVVLDAFGRIVNLAEIREGIRVSLPRPRQGPASRRGLPFRFRLDPVPHSCDPLGRFFHRRRRRMLRKPRKLNLNYCLDALSHSEDIEGWHFRDARLHARMRAAEKLTAAVPSWKHQGKKKRQWM